MRPDPDNGHARGEAPVTEQGVVAQARCLRAEARRLLDDEGLLALIGGVGPALAGGSFALDLMTWPDIDIDVQLPHERDIAVFFDLGRSIATKFQVTKMSFSNHCINPDVPFDHGLYWGIRLMFSGRIWKIDLWGLGEGAFPEHRRVFEGLQRRLEGSDRDAILHIKDAVCRRPDYRFGVTSMDIYAAVVEHNVRTLDEFESWLGGRVASKQEE